MPKLKKTEAEKRVDRLTGLVVTLRSACILEHGDLVTAAQHMGLSQSTLYRRLREPEKITLEQLSAMCGALPKELKDTIRQFLL